MAKEVCEILGLRVKNSVRYLDDDEKNLASIRRPNQGRGNPNVILINEPGLYSLILRSRKPEAKQFKRWITHAVIPEIRRTGGLLYATKAMTEDEIMVLGFNTHNMIPRSKY